MIKKVFLFPTNVILHFCQEGTFLSNDLLPKNTVKDDISGIIEKDDIHARKYGISSARERKVIKMFTQSNTHRENYCD